MTKDKGFILTISFVCDICGKLNEKKIKRNDMEIQTTYDDEGELLNIWVSLYAVCRGCRTKKEFQIVKE